MIGLFLVYLSGMITGFLLAVMLVMHIGKKAIKKVNSASLPIKPKITKEDIHARIAQVKDITDTQLEMQANVDGPQRNGMDGRNKNGITANIKALEEEKMTILKSIIMDGYDPVISVINIDGSIENVPLSEFITRSEDKLNMKSKDSNKESKKDLSKFTILTGGKNDGGNTTH